MSLRGLLSTHWSPLVLARPPVRSRAVFPITRRCDPGLFQLPGTDVWVLYTMQKTCADSGREFYALGRYEGGKFTLLDARSDIGNNLWDGGEGYAHMNVLDPRGGGRMLWTGAVIEGDRDPSDPHVGFPLAWTAQRGWFGVLTLPRVVTLGNVTHDDGSSDYFLQTAPLPELATLREKAGAVTQATRRLKGGDAEPVPLRGRSVELLVEFDMPP